MREAGLRVVIVAVVVAAAVVILARGIPVAGAVEAMVVEGIFLAVMTIAAAGVVAIVTKSNGSSTGSNTSIEQSQIIASYQRLAVHYMVLLLLTITAYCHYCCCYFYGATYCY